MPWWTRIEGSEEEINHLLEKLAVSQDPAQKNIKDERIWSIIPSSRPPFPPSFLPFFSCPSSSSSSSSLSLFLLPDRAIDLVHPWRLFNEINQEAEMKHWIVSSNPSLPHLSLSLSLSLSLCWLVIGQLILGDYKCCWTCSVISIEVHQCRPLADYILRGLRWRRHAAESCTAMFLRGSSLFQGWFFLLLPFLNIFLRLLLLSNGKF